MGSLLNAVASALGAVPHAAELLPGEVARGVRAAGSGLAALGARDDDAGPAYTVDPATGQMSAQQAAPSPMWHNLLKGALLGLATGVSPRGAALYLSQRQQHDQLARAQAQKQFQDQLAAGQAADQRTLNAARMHQIDLDNAKTALWLKDEPAEYVAALREPAETQRTHLEASGHESVGHIADESDLDSFRLDHPELAKRFVAGDVHLVPTYGDDGKISGFDVYEKMAPGGVDAPIGKPTAVKLADGRTVTLPADTTFAQLNAITGAATRDSGAKALKAIQAREAVGPTDTAKRQQAALLIQINERKNAALEALNKPGTFMGTATQYLAAQQRIQDAYEQELSTAVGHSVPHYRYPGTAPAMPVTAQAAREPEISAGSVVTLKNGKTVTVTAVNPDGSFTYK